MSAATAPAAEPAPEPADTVPLTTGAVLRYGLFGLPLALVALPLYLLVPKFYSDRYGMSLATLGALLLALRLLDACADPLIGGWIDQRRRTHGVPWLRGYRRFIVLACVPLGAGFAALFLPPATATSWFIGSWLAGALVLVYAGFSIATIAHQAWGAELATAPAQRSRVTVWREGCALLGVLAAAVVPQLAGMTALVSLFIVTLAVGAAVLVLGAPHAPIVAGANLVRAARAGGLAGLLANTLADLRVPWGGARFRALLGIYLLNGIASAIPATLVLFFVRDVVQREALAGLFLVAYFLAGALALPLWLQLARRLGLARAWLVGMLAAIAAFAWAAGLGAGDTVPYLLVCSVAGAVLGADLALPPALLAGVIQEAGHQGRREGAYFGLWTFATKLNLALAAGVALPLLTVLGYAPGAAVAAGAGATGVTAATAAVTVPGAAALTFAYAVLPCLLKGGAAWLLWRSSFYREKS